MTPALLTLWKSRFSDVPLYCGDETAIGTDELEEWRDFTFRETTDDQKRIEDYLKVRCGKDALLLHVGIGNSRLAQDFCPSVSLVVGITTQPNEVDHALSLGIANYFPLLMNKFSLTFACAFTSQFNFVIDNNPSGFCCCFFHLSRMMTSYLTFMREGGQIVTDRTGLGWHVTNGNSRWCFDFADWAEIASALKATVEDVDGSIYIMRRAS